MNRQPGLDVRMVDVHDVRDINQTLFLHLIRERQPVSRADLAKATGLRAGTVSAIVGRLIAQGLVYEGVAGPSSGGRPPLYLYVNADSAYVLAIDIGVRDTVYAVFDFNGRMLMQQALLTHGRPTAFLGRLAEQARATMSTQFPRARFHAVGVSVPGLVDRAEQRLVVSPNLEWRDVAIGSTLEQAFGLPVFVENDANAAALGELWYGPTEEARIRTLLFVLVVEGIGTGLIINGQLHVGTRIGLGGFGHMTLDPSGPRCTCGRRGCWEALASNRATLERYRHLVRGRRTASSMVDLLRLAQQGDAAAERAIVATAAYLGDGIASLAHGLSPEAIVIGGEIASAWERIGPLIEQRVRSHYIIPRLTTFRLRPASVQRPSLFGAVPVAFQHLLSDPSPLGPRRRRPSRRAKPSSPTG